MVPSRKCWCDSNKPCLWIGSGKNFGCHLFFCHHVASPNAKVPLNAISFVGRETHHEVCYERNLKKPKNGVVEVLKVTKASHGFDGFLGICVGHPKLMAIQNVAAQETLNHGSLLDILRAEAKKENSMTLQDILAVWDGKKGSSDKVGVATISPEAKRTIDTTPTSNTPIPPPPPLVERTLPLPPPLPVATTPTVAVTTPPPAAVTTPPPPATPPAAAAPSTPAVKTSKGGLCGRKRSLEDLAPGVRSPERMQNGLHCSGCNHNDLKGLISYERNHFNTNLCSQLNYPDQCSGCKKSLPRTKDPRACVEIKGVFHVRCCHNAINHRDHPCVFALCHRCWVSKSAESSSPKKQRATRNAGVKVLPGEVLLHDGTIAAANR